MTNTLKDTSNYLRVETQRDLAINSISPMLFLMIVNYQFSIVNCIFRGVPHKSTADAISNELSRGRLSEYIEDTDLIYLETELKVFIAVPAKHLCMSQSLVVSLFPVPYHVHPVHRCQISGFRIFPRNSGFFSFLLHSFHFNLFCLSLFILPAVFTILTPVFCLLTPRDYFGRTPNV